MPLRSQKMCWKMPVAETALRRQLFGVAKGKSALMTFQTLTKQLTKYSPIEIDGRSYRLYVIDVREARPYGAVEIAIGAEGLTGLVHSGELRLSRDRFERDDVVHLAINTISRIISGQLPPGAREFIF